MKINSIHYNKSLNQGAAGSKNSPTALGVQEMLNSQNFKERNYAGLCGEKRANRGYNAAYSGSFTGKSEAAAIVLNKGMSLGQKIMKSDFFAKSMGMINDHNIASSAFMALILAGILRPATILSLPGKEEQSKKDKLFAAGHAMASGIIGFVASVILTSPLDAAVKKVFGTREVLDDDGNVVQRIKGYDEYGSKRLKEISDDLKKLDAVEETLELKKQKRLLKNSKNALKQISKNIPDWIIGIPRSALTIALIPPILVYVFGYEKKDKKTEQPIENTQNNNPSIDMMRHMMKSFNEFKGGLK